VSRSKPRRQKRKPAHETLTDAQGEFHDARTFLAIAVRVMDRFHESPADPDVRATVGASEVTLVLSLALKRLEAGIDHLDCGITGLAVAERSP
jgi:hypothetical protein